ncbi:MAG: hypothetical protein LQ338_004853 [Usnochroma carphineum]|nr:MAG: hypothetical protein LQ338_004853 [Usnochroma carphineum]
MSTSNLSNILSQLENPSPLSPQKITSLLSSAKRELLTLNALIPTPTTPSPILALARQTLETGALLSIRLQQPDAFTRYYQQLLPFYEIPESFYGEDSSSSSQRSKVTGLYLLLLLTKGDYAAFHTVLEGLEVELAGKGKKGLEGDEFLNYPVKLERWLMMGSYDLVWGATKREGVPSEEFGVFSERADEGISRKKVLVGTIRDEIASCSEKAYPSLPIANAKNLLFLDSEGSVVDFAQARGWVVKDGRIYFPQQEDMRTEKEILVASGQVIENTIGYARELETIV